MNSKASPPSEPQTLLSWTCFFGARAPSKVRCIDAMMLLSRHGQMPFICPKYHLFGNSILAILYSPLVLWLQFWLCVWHWRTQKGFKDLVTVRKAPERMYFLLKNAGKGMNYLTGAGFGPSTVFFSFSWRVIKEIVCRNDVRGNFGGQKEQMRSAACTCLWLFVAGILHQTEPCEGIMDLEHYGGSSDCM